VSRSGGVVTFVHDGFGERPSQPAQGGAEGHGIKPGVAVKCVVTNAGALLTRDEPKSKGADIVRKLRGKGNGSFSTSGVLKQTRG